MSDQYQTGHVYYDRWMLLMGSLFSMYFSPKDLKDLFHYFQDNPYGPVSINKVVKCFDRRQYDQIYERLKWAMNEKREKKSIELFF